MNFQDIEKLSDDELLKYRKDIHHFCTDIICQIFNEIKKRGLEDKLQ